MELIWKYWQDPTCRMLYAGSMKNVGDDVKQILIETIMTQGNVNEETAKEFNESHEFASLYYRA
jgi:sulfite reductase alpha subunit-like flavoprotein